MSHLDLTDSLFDLIAGPRRKLMPKDQFHGMLSAIICGPGMLHPAKWLSYLFPSTKNIKTLVNQPWFTECIGMISEIYEDILFSLRQGIFMSYFSGPDRKAETLNDAQGWCTGFLYGMSIHGEAFNVNENESLAALVAPILFIANPEEMQKEMDKDEFETLAKNKDILLTALKDAIPRIYDHFNMGVKPELKKEWFTGE